MHPLPSLRRRTSWLWRTAWLALGLLATFAPGCQTWRNRDNASSPTESAASADPPKKRGWLGGLLPPPGEYFFDERSHEIERSLRRSRPNVDF